jgi:hypothetical protein
VVPACTGCTFLILTSITFLPRRWRRRRGDGDGAAERAASGPQARCKVAGKSADSVG